MTDKRIDNITLWDAQIFYRNFAGNPSRYNAAGNRNFCVYIDDPEVAQRLKDDGWNVRIKAPRDEGDQARYFIQVAVNYNYRIPPKVTLVTSKRENLLSQDTIGELDYAEIKKVDLVIRPRLWDDDDGTTKVKAYLKTLRAEIDEDPIEARYAADEHPEE